MTTAEQGRRRLFVFAMGIAVLFGGLGISNWWMNRDDLREGSKLVSQTGERMPITKVATSFRGIFRFENRARELVLTTEKVWFKRPFQSRIETYQGGTTTGRASTVRQSAFGILTSRSTGTADPLNIAVPPSLASGDVRPDAVLDEAVRMKVVLVREQREVYGRRCQVYRAGGSILAGDLPAYEPGSGSYADFCIDRNGIVVEEYWVQDDELLRRRVALELEVDVPISKSVFRIDVPETPGMRRGSVDRIPSDEGSGLWTLPKTPEGYDRLGRYAVVISPDSVPSAGGQLPAPPITSTSEVYVRGPELVVIDQDPSLAQATAREDRPSRDVEFEVLREGKVSLDARMSEVRAQTPDGSFVRVIGTIPTDELIDIADRLRQQE